MCLTHLAHSTNFDPSGSITFVRCFHINKFSLAPISRKVRFSKMWTLAPATHVTDVVSAEKTNNHSLRVPEISDVRFIQERSF